MTLLISIGGNCWSVTDRMTSRRQLASQLRVSLSGKELLLRFSSLFPDILLMGEVASVVLKAYEAQVLNSLYSRGKLHRNI